MAFGADREAVTVSGDGITGTGLAQQSTLQKVDETLIKSKLPALRAELENIYALANAIKTAGTKFNKESVDIFRITIQVHFVYSFRISTAVIAPFVHVNEWNEKLLVLFLRVTRIFPIIFG